MIAIAFAAASTVPVLDTPVSKLEKRGINEAVFQQGVFASFRLVRAERAIGGYQ